MNSSSSDHWSTVVGTTTNEISFSGYPVHIDGNRLVFESCSRTALLESVDQSADIAVQVCGQAIYDGAAKVTKIVDGDTHLTCQVELQGEWRRSEVEDTSARPDHATFLKQWETFRLVRPEFKVAVADLCTYLTELRAWLASLEPTRALEGGAPITPEKELQADVFECLNSLFERLEETLDAATGPLVNVYQAYVRRALQPLLFPAPFADRVIQKPLGYAGDFEMVNMILRRSFDGTSLYGRLLHAWFVSQPPAEAHRNRIEYLKDVIIAEGARRYAAGRKLKCLSAGCGPAWEVQRILQCSPLAETMQFDLLDSSKETLEHAREVLEQVQRRSRTRTQVRYLRKSVVQLLKSGLRAQGRGSQQYDLVYCAGLYDYLPDEVCRDLTEGFHRMLKPGGLLIVTNVNSSNPIRNWLDIVLEWPLIYRDTQDMWSLCAGLPKEDEQRVLADPTGVNLFLEVRRTQ